MINFDAKFEQSLKKCLFRATMKLAVHGRKFNELPDSLYFYRKIFTSSEAMMKNQRSDIFLRRVSFVYIPSAWKKIIASQPVF